jgi:hypothetical protein
MPLSTVIRMSDTLIHFILIPAPTQVHLIRLIPSKMKNCFLISFALVAIHCSASEAVKKDLFQRKIDSINYYLGIYDTLSPFADYDNRFELIDSVQTKIMTGLLDVLNDGKILKYDLEKTFNPNSLYHTSSADQRVQFFTIDAKNGGSWRQQLTILHTREKNGTVHAIELGEAYSYAAFGSIEIIDTVSGAYIALGGVATCNTCEFDLAILIHPDSTVPPEEILSFETRTGYNYSLDYNSESRTLTYEFSNTTEDPLMEGTPSTFEIDSIGDHVLKFTYSGTFLWMDGYFIKSGECWSSEVMQ